MGVGLARAQSALRGLASELVAGDSVQWLSVGPDATPVAFAISGPDDSPLVVAIDGLELAPEREISVLIEAAYEVAGANFDPSALNRVLLVSDGADHPATLPSVIATRAEAGIGNEIRMSVLGTGAARENGHRTLRVASRFGRGAYRYLDDVDAMQASAPSFDELFGVALDDVKLELSLPWYFSVERPFLGAVVDSNTPIEPQYVAPGGTMTFLFRLIACSETAYGDVTVNAPTIEARLSWLSPSDGSPGNAIESALPATLADQMPSQELTQLLAVASYADALRTLDKKRLNHAITLLEGAQLSEIAQLLGNHPVLTAP
jgi:Ca-activated chloride channel family protein